MSSKCTKLRQRLLRFRRGRGIATALSSHINCRLPPIFSGPKAVFISGRKSRAILSKIIVFWGVSGGDIPLFRWQGFDQRSVPRWCDRVRLEESRKDVEPFRTTLPLSRPAVQIDWKLYEGLSLTRIRVRKELTTLACQV